MGVTENFYELEEFFLHLTFFRSFFRPQKIAARVVSIIITILVLFLVVYNIVSYISYFVHHPISTQSSLEIVNAVPYPKVTVCTKVRANQTALKERKIGRDLQTYMSSIFDAYQIDYTRDLDISKMEKAYRTSMGEEYDTAYIFFMRNSISCKDVIKSCSVQGRQIDCCKAETSTGFLGPAGKCFELHQAAMQQTLPGRSGRLSIHLKHWNSLYQPETLAANSELGADVWLTFPEEKIPQNAISIAPGQRVTVALTQKLIYRIMSSDSSCCKPNQDNSYSKTKCIKECISRLFENMCKCHLIGSVAPSQSDEEKACEPAEAFQCAQASLQNNNRSSFYEMFDVTQECNCQPNCRTVEYTNDVSYGMFGQKNEKTVHDDSIIEIFHQDLSIEKIEEVAVFSFHDLLSAILITIVTWTGISILALIQTILHFLYCLVCKLVKRM